jgi:protein-disulfide isomerase
MLGARDAIIGSIGAALVFSAVWRSSQSEIRETTTLTPDSVSWGKSLLYASDSLRKVGGNLQAGRGTANWIIAFNDYSCAYCTRLARSIDTVALRAPDVAITIIPLASFLQTARDSANLAVICAAASGQLAQLHSELAISASKERETGGEKRQTFAAKLRTCMQGKEPEQKLRDLRAYARALLIPGVPFVIGASGRWQLGLPSSEELERLAHARPSR